MNKSESIAKLADALAKAQGEFGAVPFNAVNPFLKNRYADLGAVIETAKPILAKHGLSVSQLMTSSEDRIGVTTILMHASGEWLEATASLPLGDEKGKSLAQVAGSVVTYLRRYALASVLGMYADEDQDGNGQHTGTPPRTVPARPPALAPDLPKQQAEAVKARVMQNPNGGPAEDELRKKAAFALRTLVPDQDQRHALARFLTGVTDPAKWTNGQCGDITRWIAVRKVENDWLPSQQAIDDAKLMLAHVMPQLNAAQAA